MKNKWIYTALIYGIAIALQVYALIFAKRDSGEMWFAMSLSVVLLFIFYVRRVKHINRNSE
jgi:hypothetical protein